MSSCGAPAQGTSVTLAPGATVIEGHVLRAGAPAAGAYVRLHDAGGEFTAEVVASPAGEFRFFAAPGPWEVRVLAPGASARASLHAVTGLNRIEVALG